MVTCRTVFFEHQLVPHVQTAFATKFYGVAQDPIDPIRVNTAASTLLLFRYDNRLRVFLTQFIQHRLTKGFVVFVIVLNAITLALRDPQLQNVGALQSLLNVTDILFLIIFAVEMVIKILVHGLLLHSKSYLRHPWNVLDAVVVVSGFISQFVSKGPGVSAIRVIRVFRPLRAFAYVNSLRKILDRVTAALPKMVEVFLFLIFVLWLFDVVAVHMFMGTLNSRCFANVTEWNASISTGHLSSSYGLQWIDGYAFAPIQNDTRPCSVRYSGGRQCSTATNGVTLEQRCLSFDDALLNVPTSVYNWNNCFASFLLIFKIVTRDNWPDDFLLLCNAIGLGGTFSFMFFVTLFAGYFCVNLFIAVFETVFSRNDDDMLVDSDRGVEVKFTTVVGARTIAHSVVFASSWAGRTDRADRERRNGDGDDAHAASTPRGGDSSAGSPTFTFAALGEGLPDDEPVDDNTPRRRGFQPTSSSGGAAALEDSESWKKCVRRFFNKTGVRPVAKFCNSGAYQLTLIALVAVNAGILAIDRTGQSQRTSDLIRWSSYAFSIFFIVDALIKLVGFGPSYFLSGLNVADFILCVISIPDIVNLANSAFTALRAFRLLRLLHVSKRWKDLQRRLEHLQNAVQAVGSVSLVAFIVIYIYAILGFQLFGEDIAGMRMSFDTVFDSLLTVFICVTGENQNDIAAQIAENYGRWSVVYFLTLTIFGNFILTNLFIAIILENFASNDEPLWDDLSRESGASQDGGDSHPLPPTALESALGVKQRWNRRVLLQPDDVESQCVGLSDGPAQLTDTNGEEEKEEGVEEVSGDNDDPHRRNHDDDVELVPSALHGVQREDLEGSEYESEGPAGSGYRRLLPPSAVNFHAIAGELVRILGLPPDHGIEAMLAQFAKDERITEPAIVADATTLAADAEKKIIAMEERQAESRQREADLDRLQRVAWKAVLATSSRRFTTNKKKASAMAAVDGPTSAGHLSLANFSIKFRKFQTTAERQANEDKWAGLVHPSLICGIPSSNVVRRRLGAVLKHPLMEWGMLLVTIASSVFLCFDAPIFRDTFSTLINVSDIVFATIFLVEAAAKMFTIGLWQHRGAYFRSAWNCIDLAVALFSLIALFESSFKVLRTFRVLRFLNLSFTLRVITAAILSAIPGMASVTTFVALLFLIYAVFGVGLFKGMLYGCTDPSISNVGACVGFYNITVSDAFLSRNASVPRQWVQLVPQCSYDNVESALYCLFLMANQDNWFTQMYAAVDHVWRQPATVRNANPLAALYFVSFMVVGQFFAVNLFIGVLVDRFLAKRRRGEGHALLTQSQQQWILVQKVLFRAEVRGEIVRPRGWRGAVFGLCSHWMFDAVMYSMIAANSVLLSSYFYGMSADLQRVFDGINVGFVSSFTVEIILKSIAFGPSWYWSTQWNRLDVMVVALSWVGVGFGTNSQIVGVFRVSRLLLLLRKMRGLQTLFITLYHAIPEFLNVAFVLLVIYFIFGIVGVYLFSGAPIDPTIGSFINPYVNFSHIGMAFVSLYIMMTQESWQSITDQLADYSLAAYPFAIIFMVVVSWVAINLLITVVIDVFGEAEETEKQAASLRVIDHFRSVWCQYDPRGTKKLPANVVLHILPTMPSGVWDRSLVAVGHLRTTPWLSVLRQLERLHIPLDEHKQVRYEDCVASLAMRLFSLTTTEAIRVSQRTVYGVAWKASHYSIHHEFAALLISKSYRRYRNTRRERILMQQIRTLKDQHGIVVESELQPLRLAYHDAIRLIRWIALRASTGVENVEDGDVSANEASAAHSKTYLTQADTSTDQRHGGATPSRPQQQYRRQTKRQQSQRMELSPNREPFDLEVVFTSPPAPSAPPAEEATSMLPPPQQQQQGKPQENHRSQSDVVLASPNPSVPADPTHTTGVPREQLQRRMSSSVRQQSETLAESRARSAAAWSFTVLES